MCDANELQDQIASLTQVSCMLHFERLKSEILVLSCASLHTYLALFLNGLKQFTGRLLKFVLASQIPAAIALIS